MTNERNWHASCNCGADSGLAGEEYLPQGTQFVRLLSEDEAAQRRTAEPEPNLALLESKERHLRFVAKNLGVSHLLVQDKEQPAGKEIA